VKIKITRKCSHPQGSDDISNQQDAAKFVLLILLSLLYMFRATVSPIFRSTLYIQLFGTMYRLCCLLPTGDTDWMETIKQILLHLVGC